MPALLAALPWPELRRVVIVDNGSTDRTAELARDSAAVVVSEPRRGYGAACLRGLRHLADDPPEVVAFVDGDLCDDPQLLPAVFAPIIAGEAELVIASRVKLALPGALTLPQRVGNALSCRLITLLTGERYSDLGPMRAIRWSSLDRLDMRDTTWGWTVEMQFKAAAMGMTIREIDVPYRPRRAGHSKISGSLIGSVRAGSKILTTLARLWWRQRRRRL